MGFKVLRLPGIVVILVVDVSGLPHFLEAKGNKQQLGSSLLR